MRKLFGFSLALLAPAAMADQSIYSDQLDSSWQNWSWVPTNLSSTAPLHAGVHTISATPSAAWQALYLAHGAQSTSGFQALTFWINGGASGGQLLQVNATLGGNAQAAYLLPALPKSSWVKVTVPLVGVGAAAVSNFDGFWIQDRSGVLQSGYSVDDIVLTSKPASVPLQNIFSDGFRNSWTNASTATVDLSNTSPVHVGTRSVAVTGKSSGDGFFAKHASLDGSLYQTLRFWVNGGPTGGQLLRVKATTSGVAKASFDVPALPKDTWQQIVVPLSALSVDTRGDFDGFMIVDRAGKAQPTYYLDDLFLSTTPGDNPQASIKVNATAYKAISPYIYGANFTDFTGMGQGFTLNRQGGNRLTAYNWENNASNAGSDWYFQNDGYMGTSNEPGWTVRNFVQSSISHGATPLVTVPTAGYVAADKNGDGDVRNTPNYLSVRFKKSLPNKPTALVYPPDSTDGAVYQDEFVRYIKQFAKSGYPVFFDLDNEPDLWSSSHAEIHPSPVKYSELLDNNITYSLAIKKVYPTTKVFGFASYGWSGYRTLQDAPDAAGRDFIDFYLAGMKQAEVANGKRLLDVLDLHWYPEARGDGQRITVSADTPGLAEARIQAPRSLWDPTYVETSWIADSIGGAPIRLIPDTMARITGKYPGTKLAFSEYNYGGGNAASGAVAQADVLGIFGRYSIYAAANWGIGASDAAEVAGFKAFTDYDRAGSKFGDRCLAVSGESPATNSVYAALDSTKAGRMTLLVINKTTASTPFAITPTGFSPSTGKAYTVSAGHFGTPVATAVTVSSGVVRLKVPPRSVTTVELSVVGP